MAARSRSPAVRPAVPETPEPEIVPWNCLVCFRFHLNGPKVLIEIDLPSGRRGRFLLICRRCGNVEVLSPPEVPPTIPPERTAPT